MDEKIFDQINDFLLGRMNEIEKQAFEQKLATDPELQADLESQREVIQAVKDHQLMAQMNDWHKTVNSGGNNFNKWLFGGGIFLLLTACLIGFLLNKSDSLTSPCAEQLDAYYIRDVDLDSRRGQARPLNPQYQDGKRLYMQRAYEAAREHFQSLISTSNPLDQVHYDYGITLVALGRGVEARPYLEAWIDHPDSIYWRSKARYYTALAFAQECDTLQALEILTPMIAPDFTHTFKKDALQLAAALGQDKR